MQLTDCFIELIAFVLYKVPELPKHDPGYDSFRKDIMSLLDESEHISEQQGFSSYKYATARFAIVVWIDEIVLKSSWNGKRKWQRDLLQRIFYKTNVGGIEFYEKLDRLEPEENDVREIFFLCLVGGFSGKYGFDENSLDRIEIIRKNMKRLTGSIEGVSVWKDGGGTLFPFAEVSEPEEIIQSSPGISPATYIAGAIPVLLLVFLFLLYRFILEKEAVLSLVQ